MSMINGKKIIAALYTWAIPGYWLQDSAGENHFSAYGDELTAEQRKTAHTFPCNCFKKLVTEK